MCRGLIAPGFYPGALMALDKKEGTYDAAGRITQADYYTDHLMEVNEYDEFRGWLNSRQYDHAYQTFKFKNFYDETGNVETQEVRNSIYGQHNYSYKYDALDRITEFKIDGVSRRKYAYDDNGNRITHTGYTDMAFTYNGTNNQLNQFVFTDGGTTTTTNYEFDDDGRANTLTENGAAHTLEYDIFNNMTRYHGSGVDYQYMYDHQNQRVAKMNITGSKTKYYLKTGATVMAEYGTDTDLEAEYIYGPTGMIAKYSPSKGYIWYMKDHLGSTRELSSADYAYQTRRDYFPYGEAVTASGTETDYLFTGKELDNGTGLYYFGARYYAPGVGRWLVVDPLANMYPSWSPYVYTLNNPLKYIDPNGLEVYGATVGARAAATIGGLVEVGVVWDDEGRIGILFKGELGTGVEVSVAPALNSVKNSVKSIIGQIISSFDSYSIGRPDQSFRLGDGDLYDLNLSSTWETKASFLVGCSWDLGENLDQKPEFTNIEIGSVGGGVYKSGNLVLIIYDKNKWEELLKNIESDVVDFAKSLNNLIKHIFESENNNKENSMSDDNSENSHRNGWSHAAEYGSPPEH